MIITGICWLLITAGAAVMCVTAGNVFFAALLAALIVLPPIFMLINLIARSRLRLELICPVNLGKGETGAAELALENGSRLPLVALSCRVEVRNLLTGRESVTVCRASLPPRGRRTLPLELSSRLCGRLEIRARRARLYDCFRLLPVSCRAAAAASVTVQPDTFPMTVTVSPNLRSMEESESYSQERPGSDLSETFQIREYREGDSLRQMHWKLTQKLDRPIVRDPSLPITRSVLLLWERTADTAEEPEDADAQAEVLVSLAKALPEASVRFNLCWNEKESGRCALLEIADMDDLIGALPRLLSASAQTGGDSGAEIFRRTAAKTNYAHVVYLTRDPSSAAALPRDAGRVTVLLCGGQGDGAPDGELIAFDRRDFARQLEEIIV